MAYAFTRGLQRVRYLFQVILIFVCSTSVWAQPEFGRCGDQDVSPSVTMEKALKSFRKGDLPMTNLYINTEVRKEGSHAHVLYLMGEIKMAEQKPMQALKIWEQLMVECPEYKGEVWFFLGSLWLGQGDTVKGVGYIEQYLTNEDRDGAYDADAKAIMQELRAVKELKRNIVPFVPELVPGINTSADEFLVALSPDGSRAYFTRKMKKRDLRSGPAIVYQEVEQFTEAAFEKEKASFTTGEAMPWPFNQGYNEGGPSITANNREMFFTVCKTDANGYRNCDIFWTKKHGDEWSAIAEVPGGVNNSTSWESQPSVSANGDWLYFTSNRAGGKGGLDVYRSRRLSDGTWSSPESLPAFVNTSSDEKSPFLHPDGTSLYFASKGHPGAGGFDLFLSRLQPDGATWSSVQNMGIPINTPEDEIGLFVDLAGQAAYFSSTTLKGVGGWDLYRFSLPEKSRPSHVSLIKGEVEVNEGNPNGLVGAVVSIKNLQTKEIKELEIDPINGSYAAVVRLQKGAQALVQVQQKGSAFNSVVVSEEETNAMPVVETKLAARSIQKGVEYSMSSIRFSTNSSHLNEAALAVIAAFSDFLFTNSTVTVEVQGHTDNIGDDAVNRRLSDERAQAVRNELIRLGIAAHRLKAKGYGTTKPIESNSSETGRSQNRRTVFVILSE